MHQALIDIFYLITATVLFIAFYRSCRCLQDRFFHRGKKPCIERGIRAAPPRPGSRNMTPRRIRHLITQVALCILLSACQKYPHIIQMEGPAQGTRYHLTFIAPADLNLPAVEQAVTQEFDRIDRLLSNYRADSTVSVFNANRTSTAQDVGHELVTLIDTARHVYRASQGCYDLTSWPLFDLWGFTTRTPAVPPPDDIAGVLATVGMDKLVTHDSTRLRKRIPALHLDMSSIGQGHAVARIAALLERFGIMNYLVEIGGEMQVRGHKPHGQPWRIAVENPLPDDSRRPFRIFSFDDGEPVALMTSGTYRHYVDEGGRRYSHILDARTGAPVEHQTVSVSVLHPDPATADAWSTALLCLGSSAGMVVADEHALPALFIDLHDQQLSESRSRALRELRGIRVSLPGVHGG